MNNRSVSDLVALFAEHAHAWGGALDAAKPTKANVCLARYVAIYRELKRRGADAVRHLLPLLNDDRPFVALATATLVLEVFPNSATPALERLSREPEFVGLIAETTLKEWRAGRAMFPE